jgi:hypothetical protein
LFDSLCSLFEQIDDLFSFVSLDPAEVAWSNWLTFCVWPFLGRIIATTFTSLDDMMAGREISNGKSCIEMD